MKNMLRLVLILLTGFLALTAIGGSVGLLVGFGAPPVEMIAHSPFKNYVIPGLALLLIVGGAASLTLILLIKRHPRAALASLLTALIIIIFEIVEILAIGSPAGIARNLQMLYLTLGVLIGLCTLALHHTQTASN